MNSKIILFGDNDMFILVPRFIVSSLSAIITPIVSFPGRALEEISHKGMCLFYGVPTYKRTYIFPVDETIDTIPDTIIYTPRQALFIALVPFINNSIFCALLTIPLSLMSQVHFLDVAGSNIFLNFFCMWIGLSVGFYAIPYENDIDKLLELTSIEELNFISTFCFHVIQLFSLPFLDFVSRIGYTILLMILMNKFLI